jgi:ATP-dependent Clp protease adaptor protein ClpS
MEIEILDPITEIQLDAEIKEMIEPTKAIILYNDDVNNFIHVINCLMLYCDHSKEQAEQIALIVHHSGKCDIKHGSYNKLRPIYEALQEHQLSVKIE